MNSQLLNFSSLSELGQLPFEVRDEVGRWLTELRRVTRPVTKALEQIAQRMGVSPVTARRKYDAFRKHGVTGLINRAKAPQERRPAEITPEFLEWFRALVERNQRKSRPAWRQFSRMWFAGEKIPGLDRDIPRHRLPIGASYENLLRQCNDKFALTVMRQGTAAAARYAPQTFTTRAGLWVGSHYMFDDLWHDNFVVFRGKPVRVLELDALDVFSGCKFAWGMQPRMQREDGSFENLKESATRMLLASVLWNEGYSERGTVLVVEHGTAAIRERVEELLHDYSGGLIRVDRSGIIGKTQAVQGMFPGRGGGNPRFKSHLESLRNLIHNEFAMLPGQTGKDVEHRPESTAGLLDHAEDLLKAVAVLAQTRPEKAALIRLPLWEYHSQFLPLATAIYATINARDWHELEGWAECGHIALEYRLAPESLEWIAPEQFATLPEVTRQLVVETARQDARFLRQRKLSPFEVWRNGRKGLNRIPGWVVADILGPDLAKERTCAGSYFTFEDIELSPEPLRYEARIVKPDGSEEELPAGKYQTFVNPFDLSMLFVHDARGRHLGVSRRVARPCRADTEAVQAQWGRNSKRLEELLQPIRKRHADLTRQAAEDARHNAAVLSETANGREWTRMGGKKAADVAGTLEEASEVFGSGALPQDPEFSSEEIAEIFSTPKEKETNESNAGTDG